MGTHIKQEIYKLLKWSEKYTGLDMVYLARGGFWSVFGQIATTLASLLLAIAFANLLPEEQYGNYQYILSVAGILTIATLGGMNISLVGAVVHGFENTLRTAFKEKIRWGTLGSLAGLCLAAYYFYFSNFTLSAAFLIVAALLPIRDSLQIYLSYWHGKKRFDVYNQYQIAEQVLTVTCLIATIFLTDNILIILAATFLVPTVFRLFSFARTASQVNGQSGVDASSISYGKHLSFMGVIGTFAGYLDKILIFHFLGAVPLALYSFATIPPTKVKDVFKFVGELALPRFSERTLEDIRSEMWKKILKVELVALGVSIFYILGAPVVYGIFFPKYLDSVIYSQVFVLAAFFLYPSTLLHTALIAKKETKKLYIDRVGVPVVNILLIAVLLPACGLWGAISAYVATKGIEFFVLLFLFYRK